MNLTDKQIKRILTAAGAVIQEARHHQLPLALVTKLADLEEATTVKSNILTPTQRLILTTLRDAEDASDFHNAEIVCEGIECWIGYMRISRATVNALVRMVLLHYDKVGGAEHYTINGSGRAALEDENVIERIQHCLATGQSCDERGNPLTFGERS
jgi:hypothetical protein